MSDVDVPPPFEAYKGNESYIFASYAHKDGKVIFPEIKYLHDQGYRIWYDEGIDPGNEWPEDVAKALANASLFLVFISSNAVNSRNVRNEINFALNNTKPFIAVHIMETQLPLGLALRMGDIQAVLKYRMNQASYSRKMLTTLPAHLRASHGDLTGLPGLPMQPKDIAELQGLPLLPHRELPSNQNRRRHGRQSRAPCRGRA